MKSGKSAPQPRFIMLGGFLGAGKTTTISRLAKRFQSQGKRVVVVTNDQAADLVDTNALRLEGLEVGEVAGSCFCCNFNELTRTIERLGENSPEVILAEPVGSCTDLAATVIRPLQQIYSRPLSIAPYGVILKPSHGAKILGKTRAGGFSPQANYIFRKQLEEADFLIINRIDELSRAEVSELSHLLEEQFPERPQLRLSAKTGEGFEAFCEFLDQQGNFGQRRMEVDYELYAEGEAELGWLNCQLFLDAREPFDLDHCLIGLIVGMRDRLAAIHAETAHLKAIGMWEGYYGVANLVSSFSEPTLSLASRCRIPKANVVINARVALNPETLKSLVEETVETVAQRCGLNSRIDTIQSFRPGRPVPTHRILEEIA